MVVYSFYIFDRHSELILIPIYILNPAALLTRSQRNASTLDSGPGRTAQYQGAALPHDPSLAPARRAMAPLLTSGLQERGLHD